jgi:hypothetical protein
MFYNQGHVKRKRVQRQCADNVKTTLSESTNALRALDPPVQPRKTGRKYISLHMSYGFHNHSVI